MQAPLSDSMATVVLESSKNHGYDHGHMRSVQQQSYEERPTTVGRCITNSVPDKCVFPQNRRPSAAQVLQGESIPIIDISSLDGSQLERLQTIQSLGQACADWGFFRVINHGTEASLIANMLDVTHQFFLLSSEEKMKYGNSDVLDPVRYGTSSNAKVDQFFNWRDYLNHSSHRQRLGTSCQFEY